MSLSDIVFICACIVIGLGFILVAVCASRSKNPLNFWAGSKVTEKQLTDVKGFNRANLIMWIVAGSIWVITGVLLLCGVNFPYWFVLAEGVVLIPVLLIWYSLIKKKYFKSK